MRDWMENKPAERTEIHPDLWRARVDYARSMECSTASPDAMSGLLIPPERGEARHGTP